MQNSAVAKTGKLYLEAFACSDSGSGPDWAVIENPSNLLEKVLKLHQLVVEHNLSEVRTYDGPDAWGPEWVEEELVLTNDELVVTRSSFWFVVDPKHQDYHCETRGMSMSQLAEIIKSSQSEDYYFGRDDSELKALVHMLD